MAELSGVQRAFDGALPAYGRRSLAELAPSLLVG